MGRFGEDLIFGLLNLLFGVVIRGTIIETIIVWIGSLMVGAVVLILMAIKVQDWWTTSPRGLVQGSNCTRWTIGSLAILSALLLLSGS